MMQLVQCSTCKRQLPISGFYRSPVKRKIQTSCKSCQRNYTRQWRLQHRDSCLVAIRKSHLKHQFGLTEQQYESMLVAQCGLCLICQQTDSRGTQLAVDHNHLTGHIRGLLCSRCNGGLGTFDDSLEKLDRAIMYLKENDIDKA